MKLKSNEGFMYNKLINNSYYKPCGCLNQDY